MSKQNKKKIAVKKVVPAQEITPVNRKRICFDWIAIQAFILLGVFFLHLTIFSGMDDLLSTNNKEIFFDLLHYRCWKLAALILLTLAALFFMNKLVKQKWINWPLNVLIWLVIFFYSGELWFSLYPCSQGNTEAFVANIWFKKYWNRNHYGFRDKDYNLKQLEGRGIILDVGDSYVAGHGIKDTADRTSNLLERSLKNKYFMVNAGYNGFGTQKELKLIKQFPWDPKIVILSHVVNDIEDVVPPDEGYAKTYQQAESAFTIFLYENSRNSVLGDMFYHLFKLGQYAKIQKKKNKGNNLALQYKEYTDTAIFNKHLADLQSLADYVIDSMQSKLIILTFPEHSDGLIDWTDTHVNKNIISHLKPNKNLYFLNTTPIFKQFSQSARGVNLLDGHPSKKINRVVADSLHSLITSKEFIIN